MRFCVARSARFFDVDERLKDLPTKDDVLKRLSRIVESSCSKTTSPVPRPDGSKGGRPPFDFVFMFKVLILQASHSLSDERNEFLTKDRLKFMHFLVLGLSDPMPDANTIWTFREALTQAEIEGKPAVEHVFARQKVPMRLVVRTIGMTLARVKIGLANLAYTRNRAVWLTASRTRTA